jgi:hypothetical protein
MSAPFPGMDPYLESPVYWQDFHLRFINCWCEAIADKLPANYEARLDERVKLVEIAGDQAIGIRPDLAVLRRGNPATTAPTEPGVAMLEPVTIPLVIEETERESFIKIVQLPQRTLVAVLELLSPSNKEGAGRSDYLAKRNALLLQDVHLLELDLLIAGRRLPLRRPLPPGDYYALLARADRRPDCEVYAWTLGDSLPRIPVPLKPPDRDILVDLATVFATTYERGRYAAALAYDQDPPVAIEPERLAQARRAVKT